MKKKSVYLIQLLGTWAIMAWVPTNLGKTLTFLIFWAITFYPLTKRESLFVVVACLFFSLMNYSALSKGVFTFTHPDILLMPFYELVMWGFYLLNTIRLIEGPLPQKNPWYRWLLVVCFALPFSLIANQQLLFITTSTVLVAALFFFHEKHDFLYLGYLILVGTGIEYIGIFKGYWFYPDPPWGGVPPWYLTMWGGIGLFLRRLILPILRTE